MLKIVRIKPSHGVSPKPHNRTRNYVNGLKQVSCIPSKATPRLTLNTEPHSSRYITMPKCVVRSFIRIHTLNFPVSHAGPAYRTPRAQFRSAPVVWFRDGGIVNGIINIYPLHGKAITTPFRFKVHVEKIKVYLPIVHALTLLELVNSVAVVRPKRELMIDSREHQIFINGDPGISWCLPMSKRHEQQDVKKVFENHFYYNKHTHASPLLKPLSLTDTTTGYN